MKKKEKIKIQRFDQYILEFPLSKWIDKGPIHDPK